MRLKMFILGIIFVGFFTACDEATPTLYDMDLPFEVGYSFDYQVYGIDENGDKDGSTYPGISTMECYKEEEIDGKTGLFFRDGTANDVEIYAIEEDKIFLHSDFIDLLLDDIEYEYGVKLPMKPSCKWIEFMNKNGGSWSIADEIAADFPMSDYSAATADGRLKITGEYEGMHGVDYETMQVVCDVYSFTASFDGTITDLEKSYTGDLKVDIKILQYVSTGYGKVCTLYLPSTITVGDAQIIIFGYGAFQKIDA